MDAARVDEILTAAESHPEDLARSGFWKAVAAVKSDREQRNGYAARIAAIDRRAFEQWALVRIGLRSGTLLMVFGTAVGLAVIAAGYAADEPLNGFALLAGTGVLLVTTHGLAHLIAGRWFGIRFTSWFIGSILRPQPGVKIDYESYLGAPAKRRAWMHAAGAVTSKLMPFLMLGAAWGMRAPTWAWLALIAIGMIEIATDLLWSVTSSDWKRYKREMRYAVHDR